MNNNYLHLAIMSPDLQSLALYDTQREAEFGFRSYLNEAMRLHMSLIVARHSNLEYLFPEGGRLRFGVVACDYDILRYKGCEWQNLFVDKLDKQFREAAVVNLFKPVYNGRINGV